MRIVQLVDSLGCGGAQQVVVSLAIRLQKMGHSVRIACLRRESDRNPARLEQIAASGVDILRLDKPSGFQVPTLREFTAYLKSEAIEVLNSHNHLVHHYAAFAGRLAGIPAILNTLHGTATLEMQRWAEGLFWVSCMLGDCVVSVSPEVDRVFRQRYRLARSKYHVIENGIDLSGFLAIPPRPPSSRVVFGSVGRLVPVKNHRLLIDAIARVRQRMPETELRLLGSGPLEHELRQFAGSLGLGEAVRFFPGSDDVPAFLAGLDVFVLPSDSEGLPLCLLEAIGAALPVVATAVGGVPSVIERTGAGWLCPPGDAAALAASMETAACFPNRRAKGEQARRRAAECYDAGRMASEYERLYYQLLARR